MMEIRFPQFAEIVNRAKEKITIVSGMHGDANGNLLREYNGVTGRQPLREETSFGNRLFELDMFLNFNKQTVMGK